MHGIIVFYKHAFAIGIYRFYPCEKFSVKFLWSCCNALGQSSSRWSLNRVIAAFLLLSESTEKRIEGQAARCSTAKAAKSKVNCPLSRIFIVDRSSLRCPNKMLCAALQGCNFRNSFTLQNNATIRSETIANALSPPRNFSTFFFYEPINTQLFELHCDEHTPWNYQPMQRNTSLNAFGIRFTDSSHVDPVFFYAVPVGQIYVFYFRMATTSFEQTRFVLCILN